jgi:hypothetical protein
LSGARAYRFVALEAARLAPNMVTWRDLQERKQPGSISFPKAHEAFALSRWS